MGMTNEEREKHIRIANMLIGVINDLEKPMLMYQIEKDVAKEALENYIKMLEQHPCEDTVSCNYTTEEIAKSFIEDVESVKDQLDGQTSEDCISRAYVESIVEELENICINVDEYMLSLLSNIKNAPSVTPQPNKSENPTSWIPVSERLPKAYEFVNCTCHSLIDNREDWVVETVYIPQPSDSPYSDWGNIPMLNSGDCKVVAWMHRDIPEPYKAESEE